MIKINYEGAWKELKEQLNKKWITDETIRELIDNIEQKHIYNYIDIRRRSDKEIADYCLEKHAEIYLELINLKSKMKELLK